MVTNISNIHDDMIHDAILDYYGKRLATCSSDKTIKLFDIEGESYRHITTLKGHEGPVWSLAFAHPKYGTILASASFDGTVLIWRPVASVSVAASPANWEIIARHTAHTASVNSIEFSPPEYGAMLVCGSSDGSVSVVEFKDDGSTDAIIMSAHAGGVNAVVWAPHEVTPTGVSGPAARRFASAGVDGVIRVWVYDTAANTYAEEATLRGHTDWIRDLAFAPSVVSSRVYLASAGQDGKVLVHVRDGSFEWTAKTIDIGDVVWRVSWSLSGNVLAISAGEDKVLLYKETRDGDWEACGDVAQ
ncbi:protein transport protein SEC13 [Dipodascopsis tothii]|uniref:protein transport protein SEC13 n=1 Tax=Dipodascopsis tothii TaxID=44089 RepID=UPI0034CFF2B4